MFPAEIFPAAVNVDPSKVKLLVAEARRAELVKTTALAEADVTRRLPTLATLATVKSSDRVDVLIPTRLLVTSKYMRLP
jgi:hypothetical protein